MPTLSVIVITKNEAHDIRDCLESVKWADEIVVLDSGSSDETPAICREYTTHVFVTDWPGYGKQKNRALQQATGDWVLSIDADERVSDTLHHEILTAITAHDYAAFAIPFRAIFCGKYLKHHSKSHVRLFNRTQGKFDDVMVHENILIQGKIGKLKSPIIHYTYNSLEEIIHKMNHYSSEGAKHYFQKGKKGGVATAILRGGWAFIRTYFLQMSFRDGKEGFIFAICNAQYCYYRYLKLMYLARGEKI